MPLSSIEAWHRRARTLTFVAWLLGAAVWPIPGWPITPIELAVTIDDLPTTGTLPPGTTRMAIVDQMIDTLRRHAVPGVHGFVNGGQVYDNPELEKILLAWRKGGFLLGNHTFSHLDLNRVGADDFVADIERNESLLARLSPPWSARYFRYPYLHQGDTAEKQSTVRRWLASRGYGIAPVTVYVEHWEWSDAHARCVARQDEPAIRQVKDTYLEASKARLAWARALSAQLFKRQIKHILLLHADALDAAVLDDLLRAHRDDGADLVGLESALQDPAYAMHQDAPGDGDHTFLVQVARARGVDVPFLKAGAPPVIGGLCR
jgi:peptidoglycan-N-acetylglucosamine deacetylase